MVCIMYQADQVFALLPKILQNINNFIIALTDPWEP